MPLGAWLKDPKKIPAEASFVLLETGMFWKKGGLKPYLKEAELKEACAGKPKVHAWLMHPLQKETVFQPEAGTRLAGEIEKNFKNTCLTDIELDFEIMPTPPPPWLVPFLKALRAKLPKSFTLRLTTPPITAQPLSEPYWKAEEAAPVLDVVDGFDIKVYNTGLKDYYVYEKVLTDTVTFVGNSPKKKFVLSFPAYNKRRTRHILRVENMRIITKGLQRLAPEKAKILCSDNVQLAYYARWLAQRHDVPGIEAAGAWRGEKCQ